MRNTQSESESNGAKVSRRRAIRRMTTVVALALAAATALSLAGCQTTGSAKKGCKTLDEFLGADKPSY
ncbi:MAG: hypothetical protein HUK22_07155 [Thermoguttaceae bacterium]|nr:hypothetical protein [Thermoguttaceae bacterium]